ncbi:signal recognition particle receptor subunit beta-like [Hibiscus syriacus]|uniref:Signal recognition particle receptor subunit beta-like n=1 Tax=Hibiscus syriacus TaxID=106335 RepID=A0A6A2ZM01_HIBSY|nr:signal recognition particle receptor subunit beta-like [Hibiscus syriacus]
MTADTTTLSYWFNWRFAVCALLILASMVVSAIIIWKFEGQKRSEHRRRENEKEPTGLLYEDETWNTCLEAIHPAWLLGFRIFAFFVLLALLVANVVIDGGGIFYFYTQWTFTLVTIYFGFGSAVSIYGCRKHCRKTGGNQGDHVNLDSEQGTFLPPTIGEIADVSYNQSKHYDPHEANYHPPIAGPWMYAFQIIYQMIVSMHSINAVFLIGDTILNYMRFIVSNRIFHFMDGRICCFPMDHPCLCEPLVAISVSRFVILICSLMVLGNRSDDHPVLWHLCFASNFNSVGGGIRDHDGNWIIGFHKAVGITTPFQAKLWAIFHGLEVAWSHGFELLLIQSDCANALNLVNDPNSSISPHSLVWSIFQLRQRAWVTEITWVPRESNSLANGVTKLPSPLMHDVTLLASPPAGLQDVFRCDMNALVTETQA